MLHALAFNTLLSSQETDAYIRTGTTSVIPARRRSLRSFFRCVLILSAVQVSVKLTGLARPAGIKLCPLSETTPQTYQPFRVDAHAAPKWWCLEVAPSESGDHAVLILDGTVLIYLALSFDPADGYLDAHDGPGQPFDVFRGRIRH